MNLKKMLKLGYFPKELPPPFESKTFAIKSRYIKSKWNNIVQQKKNLQSTQQFRQGFKSKYGSSSSLEYSLAKGIYSRRVLGIPNPLNFLFFAEKIVVNWTMLRDLNKNSNYSESYPVEYQAKRVVKPKSESFNNFRFKIIEKSFNKRFELRVDINQYYPSIYTHTIAWAILGKEKAKFIYRDKFRRPQHYKIQIQSNNDYKLYHEADQIDSFLRNCNERQSIGFPIGPDTSFILAEMITSRLDQEISENLKEINHQGLRYYDDYFFYFDSYDEAEAGLKTIQKVFNRYKLEINESKISIKEFPFVYEEDWAIKISNFIFRKEDRIEIRNYFSILFETIDANRNKSNWIIGYSLKRFELGSTRIKSKDWDFFLTFLLQVLLLDGSNIEQIFRIILSYEKFLTNKSRKKISEALNTFVKNHLSLNHSFEVSWALWIYRSLRLKCPRRLLIKILESDDSISKLIALDLIDQQLYLGRKPGLKKFGNQVLVADLFNSNWLFAYESYIKGWLNFGNRNILSGNEFMQVLNSYGVFFYKSDNQLTPKFKATKISTTASKRTDFEPNVEDDEFENLFEDDLDIFIDISG